MFSPEIVAARHEPWRARPGEGRRQPLRIFAAPALEALTRSRPIVPFLWLGPVAFAALGWAAARPGAASAGALLGAALAGALAWSLVEYAMHRFLFHLTPRSDAGRVALLFVHGHHHLVPDDPHRLVATPWQFGLLLALVGGLVWPLLPPAPARAFLGGFVLGYLTYEWLHHRAHHGQPRTRLGRALRRHHLLHHARPDEGRWGISTPLWDHVFRTLPRAR